VAEEDAWERSLKEAREAVDRGDFDEIKKHLEGLGFEFKELRDAGHWIYFHSALRSDPIYRTPRLLCRPHGRKRESGRVARIDQTHARRLIEALRAIMVVRDEQTEQGDEK
jgi:hypothetical protein